MRCAIFSFEEKSRQSRFFLNFARAGFTIVVIRSLELNTKELTREWFLSLSLLYSLYIRIRDASSKVKSSYGTRFKEDNFFLLFFSN